MAKKRPLWKPDWSKAPEGTVGVAYNSDGRAWFWSVKPSIRANVRGWEAWRGPDYGEGYTDAGFVVSRDKAKETWKESWIERPKE